MESREKKRRIGILGGTFDPIHKGHLLLAICAYEQFDLEKVFVMPSGNPPHKKEQEDRADKHHRLEMVKLACRPFPFLEPSDFELKRSGYIYTSETLQLFGKEYPGVDIYFILGADSLFDLETWRNPSLIMKCCTILVAAREGDWNMELEQQMNYLMKKYNGSIKKIKFSLIPVSSSEIRQQLEQDCKVKKPGITKEVAEYIRENHLYEELPADKS